MPLDFLFPGNSIPFRTGSLQTCLIPNASGKQLRKSKAAFVHAMKAYGEMEVHLHTFLTSALSKPIPRQVYYKPIGFQEVEAPRFLDKRYGVSSRNRPPLTPYSFLLVDSMTIFISVSRPHDHIHFC